MLGSISSFFDENKVAAICIYFSLIVVVTFVTTILERLSNVLKVKAKLSDGFVAGILLGVITSLPELITCLTSVIETKSGGIGTGDIIGSNIFDLFILAVCLLSCVWLFIDKKVSKVNSQTLFCVAIGTIFCFFGAFLGNGAQGIFEGNSPLVWHGFNFFSIPILGSYIAAAIFMARSNKKENKTLETNFKSFFNKLKLWSVILLLIVVAALLITASVFLTYCSTSLIQTHWGLSEGFGGAILLGLVTSLPEIVCCVNLCIHKEYNMVIDTMVGSCAFNLSILSISNIVLACLPEISGPMYDWNRESIFQLIICFFIIAFCAIYFIINSNKFKVKFSKKQLLGWNISTLSLASCSYLIFIILGFIYNK